MARSRGMQVIALMALLVGSCTAPVPNPSPSATVAVTAPAPSHSAGPSAFPTTAPSAEPSPSPTSAPSSPPAAEVVSVKDLPKVRLDPSVTTAVCAGARPDGQQADPPLDCAKELVYVAAYLASQGQVPERYYLRRNPCARKRCTDAELATGTAWVTSDSSAYEITVDSRS